MRGRLAAGLLGFVAGVSLLVWLRLPDRSPAEGSGAPAGPVGAPSKEDSALSRLERPSLPSARRERRSRSRWPGFAPNSVGSRLRSRR